jgi:hypothetical protein
MFRPGKNVHNSTISSFRQGGDWLKEGGFQRPHPVGWGLRLGDNKTFSCGFCRKKMFVCFSHKIYQITYIK